MSTHSNIEWTDATWNPVVGCTHVSAGCDHCYAVKQSFRNEQMGHSKYRGLTVLNKSDDRHFNGVVRCSEKDLLVPLKWKKPQKVFVNSMSDLFHRDVPFEFIDKVFAVMALCPQHTFQVLTKRPERMAEYFATEWRGEKIFNGWYVKMRDEGPGASWREREFFRTWGTIDANYDPSHPLARKNWWLGTSIENQKAADERIPHLLKCPAAVRFLSVEPLLEKVDLRTGIYSSLGPNLPEKRWYRDERGTTLDGIHWVIVGGESGAGARHCEIDWIRSIIGQCKSANVPCFVKQLGSNPSATIKEISGEEDDDEDNIDKLELQSRKGGDPDEWPLDLQVREFPHPSPSGVPA